MTKYTRETIYNPDGSIRKRVHTKDSFLENSIFDKDTFSMPEEPIEPIDPEVKFGKGKGRIIEKETYRIKNEKEIDIWELLINRLRDYLSNKN
jgi:hypothetical protein